MKKNLDSQNSRLEWFFIQYPMTWFLSDEITEATGVKHLRSKIHYLRKSKTCQHKILSYKEEWFWNKTWYAAMEKQYGLDVEFCLMNWIRQKLLKIKQWEEHVAWEWSEIYTEPDRIKKPTSSLSTRILCRLKKKLWL